MNTQSSAPPTGRAAETLIANLRKAADELDSAHRYGLPIPTYVSVTGYDTLTGDLGLPLDTFEQVDAWAEYAAEITVKDYDHGSERWRRGTGRLGLDGLRVTFAASTPIIGKPPC